MKYPHLGIPVSRYRPRLPSNESVNHCAKSANEVSHRHCMLPRERNPDRMQSPLSGMVTMVRWYPSIHVGKRGTSESMNRRSIFAKGDLSGSFLSPLNCSSAMSRLFLLKT